MLQGGPSAPAGCPEMSKEMMHLRKLCAVAFRFDERLLADDDCPLDVVSHGLGEPDDDPCSLGTRGRLCACLFEEASRASDVAADVVVIAGVALPPPQLGVVVRGRQFDRELEELSGSLGSASAPGGLGGTLECRGYGFIRTLGREREVAYALLGIGNCLRQAAVRPASLRRRHVRVARRGKQWMHESYGAAIHVDHPGSACLLQCRRGR